MNIHYVAPQQQQWRPLKYHVDRGEGRKWVLFAAESASAYRYDLVAYFDVWSKSQQEANFCIITAKCILMS